MIIFRALQRMNPRQLDLDPRLYQYGGGYLYLIAGALAGAHVVGFTDLSTNADVFLTHPERFAHFYIVARLISLVFGALALLAISKLARRAAGSTAAWLAPLCLALSPAFIVAVVEAKPHLPAACLTIWAALSALDYRTTGRLRDALRMGLQAGYACGLVLTGVVALLLWPAILLLRRDRQTWRHLTLALLIALGVYVVTNPYVPYNLLFNPDVFQSNIGNSTAMYVGQITRAPLGALRVGQLLCESLGPGLLIVALVGLIMLTRARPAATWLVATPGLGMLLIAILTGANKPAEFARFLVLPLALLTTTAGVLLATLAHRHILMGLATIVIVLAIVPTAAYVGALHTDAAGLEETRRLAGLYIDEILRPQTAVGVLQEPAPYATPPLDFTRRNVYLLPQETPVDLNPDQLPQMLIFTADISDQHAGAWWQEYYERTARIPGDDVRPTPITWANKLVLIYERR